MAAAKKGRAGKPVERAAKSESRLKKSYDTVNRTIAGAKESAFKRADKSKMRKKRRAAGRLGLKDIQENTQENLATDDTRK